MTTATQDLQKLNDLSLQLQVEDMSTLAQLADQLQYLSESPAPEIVMISVPEVIVPSVGVAARRSRRGSFEKSLAGSGTAPERTTDNLVSVSSSIEMTDISGIDSSFSNASVNKPEVSANSPADKNSAAEMVTSDKIRKTSAVANTAPNTVASIKTNANVDVNVRQQAAESPEIVFVEEPATTTYFETNVDSAIGSAVAKALTEQTTTDSIADEATAHQTQTANQEESSHDSGVQGMDSALTDMSPADMSPADLTPVDLTPVETGPVDLPPIDLPSNELPPIELPTQGLTTNQNNFGVATEDDSAQSEYADGDTEQAQTESVNEVEFVDHQELNEYSVSDPTENEQLESDNPTTSENSFAENMQQVNAPPQVGLQSYVLENDEAVSDSFESTDFAESDLDDDYQFSPIPKSVDGQVVNELNAICDGRPELEKQYKQVAVKIVENSLKTACNRVMVASCVKNQATAEQNLALAHELSKSDCRVLIIDSNYETRGITKFVECEEDAGLIDVINNKSDWQETITQIIEGLDVMPIGKGLLDRPKTAAARIEQLTHSVQSQYDYVIVDAGIASGIIARAWGMYCDSTYLFVSLNDSDSDIAKDAINELRTAGARLLGCIVTNTELEPKAE